MPRALELPPELSVLSAELADFHAAVTTTFDRHLRCELPAVAQLTRHVEGYRGKMLRPTLVLLGALAADPRAPFREEHATLGAVCEMVHMATLVHDDVLDEADTRRRAATLNHLHGNEAAVILGDYLIAGAFHLCSTLPGELGRRACLAVGRASMVMCTGELLQLWHREDFSLDEPTYFEIIDRKTAELISTACELGARAADAPEPIAQALSRFARLAGLAFQIQDDLLDLTGLESIVGKSVGKDLEKGKPTLPLIHHLFHASPRERGETLALLELACDEDAPNRAHAAAAIAQRLAESGSIDHAREEALSLVARAKRALAPLAPSPARLALGAMADAVVSRRL